MEIFLYRFYILLSWVSSLLEIIEESKFLKLIYVIS